MRNMSKNKRRNRKRIMKKQRRKLINKMRTHKEKNKGKLRGKNEMGKSEEKSRRSHLGCLQNQLRERHHLHLLLLTPLSKKRAKGRHRPPYTSKKVKVQR